MNKKYFMGTCVDNPFDDMGELVNVVDNYAHGISKQTFLMTCEIDIETENNIKQYPNDFTFYKSKTSLLYTYYNVYFFTHSGIEYFYQ